MKVGMGATLYINDDKRPFTVVRIISDWQIVVKRDRAVRRKDGSFDCLPNPFGDEVIITKRENGKWYTQGKGQFGGYFVLGERSMYNAPR